MTRDQALQSISLQLQTALQRTQTQVASLQESLQSESRSTAGDKHETGRAMIQAELEQAVLAQNRASESLGQFKRMAEQPASTTAGPGSLVQTDRGWFFLGLALGKVEVAAAPLMCVSLASPIGQALKGAQPGDSPAFQAGKLAVLAVS